MSLERFLSLRRSLESFALAEWEDFLCDWRARFACLTFLRSPRYFLSVYAVPSDNVASLFIPRSTPRTESPSDAAEGGSLKTTHAITTPVFGS